MFFINWIKGLFLGRATPLPPVVAIGINATSCKVRSPLVPPQDLHEVASLDYAFSLQTKGKESPISAVVTRKKGNTDYIVLYNPNNSSGHVKVYVKPTPLPNSSFTLTNSKPFAPPKSHVMFLP